MVYIGTASLALLLIVLPLAHVTAFRSVGLVTATTCASFYYFSAAERQALFWPLRWIFAFWLVAALLSLIEAPQALPALTSIWNEVIKSAIIFYTAYFLARARQSSAIWIYSAATSLSVLALVSIASWLRLDSWQAEGLVPALGDYNTSALTLLPLACMPFYSPFRQQLGAKTIFFSGLTVALVAIAAALSLSRSFWLVVAVMFISTTLALTRKSQRQWHHSLLLIGSSLGVLLTIAVLVARWRGLDLLFFDSRSVIYGPVFGHLWNNAPLTGFGYGHEARQAWYETHLSDTGIFHAHNIVLSYAEQMGIPGVIAIFAIFAGLALRFLRNLSSASAHNAVLAATGLATVTGIFLKNNLDIFFARHNLLLFFLCCGVLLGTQERTNNTERKEQQ